LLVELDTVITVRLRRSFLLLMVITHNKVTGTRQIRFVYSIKAKAPAVVASRLYFVITHPFKYNNFVGRQRTTTQIIDARGLSRMGAVSAKSAVRDEKKRATHNEVERRRRDKINGWINKLAKIVPSCNDERGKIGQVHQNSVIIELFYCPSSVLSLKIKILEFVIFNPF